jgi:N-acetylglucosaminyldiphosphoundecaprenol N-acetyl-beta-D-mannosaminyltransferase
MSRKNRWMRSFLNRASIVLADGVGVAVGARLLGYPAPTRIPITEWIWQLAEFAASQRFSLFLLGSKPGVAEAAASRLRERYPSLEIAGTHHGYFDKEPTSVSNSHVVELINSASPDILLVGFGMPIQEQWLKDNWETIEARAAITGGAVLDYTSGALRRGPRLLTDHGLEWLARLLIEPRRLWRRYVIGNPMFLARVLRQRSAGKSRFQQ